MKVVDKVFIYYNLHKKMFSIKNLKSGLVIGHTLNLTLRNATFKVSEKGRQRVLKEKRKNVHAGVVGYIDSDTLAYALTGLRCATYNPYKFSTFVDKETHEVLSDAKTIKLSINNHIPRMEYIK